MAYLFSRAKKSVLLALVLVILALTLQSLAEEPLKIWSYKAESGITSVSVSADGKYIVSSSKKSVYVLDNNGKELWKYYVGRDINSVSISADGKYIAVGLEDYIVYLFDRDRKKLWKKETLGKVKSVSISADGKYIVYGASDNQVHFLDHKGNEKWNYTCGDVVDSVSIYEDKIGAGTWGGGIYLFDINGNNLWSNKTPNRRDIKSVSVFSEGIVASSTDGNIYLFDDTGNIKWIKNLGDYPLKSVSVTPDGKYIAVGSKDANVYFF
ncbi:MAG TPA: hypothetical protein EYP22_02290, partial [Methanosarcinales archaeon]|nr:hypothetical protein [Methanosarcinales archaeon]